MFKQSLWALAAAALFSFMAAFVKLCSDQLGPLELVFYRSLFGVISIALFVYKSKLSVRTPYIWGHIKRSVLGTLSVALWFYAIGKMTFGTCMTLIYTTPLFMALNFIILARLKSTRAPWLMTASILVGFVGIICMLKPNFNSDEFIPALVCLGVSLIDLATYWQMKQMGQLKEPSWRIVFYFSVLGIVFAAVGTMFTGGFHALDSKALGGILAMGLFATLGQICTTRSYAYGNMLLSSCLGFSAIPFSAVMGILLFDDAVEAASLIGMSLILASGVTAAVTTKKMEAAERSQQAAR